MKTVIYALILPLLVLGGLVFANRESKNETSIKSAPKPLTAAEIRAGRAAWEATPEGILFKQWEESDAGIKVYTSEGLIRRSLSNYTNMDAIVTSLSLPPGSRLGLGIMARIKGQDYIISFGTLKSNEFQQLQSLKVNDKIVIRSHNVSHAPKYAYPIVSGEYVEQDGKVIYNRPPQKGGC